MLDITSRLSNGRLTASFYNLRNRLTDSLRPILKESDVCIVHNAATLHKNLPLTGALRSLADEGITRFIAWCHDFAWQEALYARDMHKGYPWDLLRTQWPGVRYVAVSDYQRKMLSDLINLPENRIRVINPGVDIAEFLKIEHPTRRLIERLNLLEADPMILLPARITRRKNIEFAVKVVAKIINKKSRAVLLVTGPPGPHNPANMAYLESLQRLKKELNLMEHVYFLCECLPEVTENMISDLYHISDLLLFPSRREGFGIPTRFVYGILGPLLRDRRVQYVKGFYRRPIKKGDNLVSEGGGRVTELTARPLINLFFPELSGLIQPLSGEYAGRR